MQDAVWVVLGIWAIGGIITIVLENEMMGRDDRKFREYVLWPLIVLERAFELVKRLCSYGGRG